jgi:hypothetical protein
MAQALHRKHVEVASPYSYICSLTTVVRSFQKCFGCQSTETSATAASATTGKYVTTSLYVIEMLNTFPASEESLDNDDDDDDDDDDKESGEEGEFEDNEDDGPNGDVESEEENTAIGINFVSDSTVHIYLCALLPLISL